MQTSTAVDAENAFTGKATKATKQRRQKVGKVEVDSPVAQESKSRVRRHAASPRRL